MKNSLLKHHEVSQLSMWWKILILLNLICDIPFLVYAFLGYQWNCKYNQLPDIIFPVVTVFFTLILVWGFVKKIDNDRKLFDFLMTALFSALFCTVVCFSTLGFVLLAFRQAGSRVDMSIQSPDTQRIAEVCIVNCAESCPQTHSLRIGYSALPFFDLSIISHEYPESMRQIGWIDNNTISVRGTENVARTFHGSLINFSWQNALIFCIYSSIKYGYVIARLRRRNL